MSSQKRPSKFSREFAAKHGLSENLNEWTQEHHAQLDAFKKQKEKARQHTHYKQNGKAYKKKSKNQQNKDAAKHREIIKALRNKASILGLQYPTSYNKGPLRQLLSQKLSEGEIASIEESAIKHLKERPYQPKAPDEDGYRKPGPTRNADGNQDPETKRHRAMGRESSGRSNAKLKALYDKAFEYSAMPPISHYGNNINQLRSILRNHINDDQINEIERQAAEEYDKRIQDEMAPRLEPMSRSLDLLDQFFDKYPDIKVVNKVGLLTHDDHAKYLRFQRSLNLERFRERDRAYENRPEVKSRRAQQQRLSIPTYFIELLETSKRQGVPMDITKNDIQNMMEDSCYYCDQTFEGPGIDAVDIDSGFVLENIRPCCTFCNKAKSNHHWHDFLRIMCNIAAVHLDDTTWVLDYTFKNPHKNFQSSNYSSYIRRAHKKGLDFDIVEEDFDLLTSEPCKYCRYSQGKVGIDRIDSKAHYTLNNVVPCCKPCNYAKHTNTLETFHAKAVQIFTNWKNRM